MLHIQSVMTRSAHWFVVDRVLRIQKTRDWLYLD